VAEIGAMVRTARKAMKLNQTELAAHAGVGRRFVSELESGKPSLEFDKVLACAAAVGIDVGARARTG
jgi:y4mF family transcriptional regulator